MFEWTLVVTLFFNGLPAGFVTTPAQDDTACEAAAQIQVQEFTQEGFTVKGAWCYPTFGPAATPTPPVAAPPVAVAPPATPPAIQPTPAPMSCVGASCQVH